jgi:hypothetical protein
MPDPLGRLDRLKAEVARGRRRATRPAGHRRRVSTPRSRAATAARWLLIVSAGLTLPFVVLLRTSTGLYRTGAVGTWPALLAGATLTFLILAGYGVWAARRVRGRFSVPKRMLQGAAILVAAYCAYGLVFLSGANAKTEAVGAEYRSLHPLLRLAVGTLVLADGDLLVTDAAREPSDYAAMGLPANEVSLHFRQSDGWAHALDVRTVGRSGVRNALTRTYFGLMGFHTLRHVGTADHLHVSLPLPDRRDP